MSDDPKQVLRNYLQAQRDSMLWKLEGLGEKQARWPLTPTGTNLLGLVKHLASMEFGYFGEVFARPAPEPLPWMDEDPAQNADFWAAAHESMAWVSELYRRSWQHSDETIEELELDAPGSVPWWGPATRDVTLHTILVHVIAETARHAGHADIVRELSDGRVGLRKNNSNIPGHDETWWELYVEKLKRLAEAAG